MHLFLLGVLFMLYTSKSISLLIASASLVTCFSNPLLAMDPAQDDQDSGCMSSAKNIVIQRVAKNAENYVLETAYLKTIERLAPELDKYCSENFGTGIGSKVLGFTAIGFSGVGLNYLKGKVGTQLENMREGKASDKNDSTENLIISKTKIMFKNNADMYIKENAGSIKLLVDPIIENYADTVAKYASAGIYTLATAGTLAIAGCEYAGPVLFVGALDVIPSLIADKAGYLKEGLKYIIGFDKMVNSAKAQVSDTMEVTDANVVLKFYNTEVTQQDYDNEKKFDNLVETTKKTGEVVINKVYELSASLYDAYLSNSSIYSSWAVKK